jgi:hypothetical protein
MPEDNAFDDEFGPDPMDRGSAKPLGTGGSGGSGSYIDPSYDAALAILGREDPMSKPWVQHAQVMSDGEAADLARRLTQLRNAAGVSAHVIESQTEVGKAVQAFIRTLQDPAAETKRLRDLREEIETKGSDDVTDALTEVCAHPGVEARLAGDNSGPDFGSLSERLGL